MVKRISDQQTGYCHKAQNVEGHVHLCRQDKNQLINGDVR